MMNEWAARELPAGLSGRGRGSVSNDDDGVSEPSLRLIKNVLQHPSTVRLPVNKHRRAVAGGALTNPDPLGPFRGNSD